MSQYRQSPFANLTPVVKNLLIINVIFYFATWLLGHSGIIDLNSLFSAFYFNSPEFRPWQIVTHMFMHDPGSISHLFFNMLALFMFGPMLEYTIGSKRFINYYFICGLGAFLLYTLVQAVQVYHITGGVTIPNGDANAFADNVDYVKLYGIYNGPMLGASGAIFGILVGFAMLFPDVELYIMFIPVPVKAKYAVIGYIVIELFSGINPGPKDNVAHFAHIGGALLGFIMIKLWGLHRRDKYYN
jgi:rhomboid-like protein